MAVADRQTYGCDGDGGGDGGGVGGEEHGELLKMGAKGAISLFPPLWSSSFRKLFVRLEYGGGRNIQAWAC